MWTLRYYPRNVYYGCLTGQILNNTFMQTLETAVYRRLAVIARERKITVQELLRVVIIPDWMARHTSPLPRTKVAKTQALVTRFVV